VTKQHRWGIIASATVAAVLAGVIAGTVVSSLMSSHARPGVSWADAVTAVATAVGVVVALAAAAVGYVAFIYDRSASRGLEAARCDVSVVADCFRYKGYDLVRATITVKNHSTTVLNIDRDTVPPFVQVQPVPDHTLEVGSPPVWDPSFAEVERCATAPVLEDQVLRPDETLKESALLPVRPPRPVAAYRVEFACRIRAQEGTSLEWSAVEFVPAGMRPMVDGPTPVSGDSAGPRGGSALPRGRRLRRLWKWL
jgi:hypothetical protein